MTNTLNISELNALNQQQEELEKLREQVELLKWEKDTIRQRVFVS